MGRWGTGASQGQKERDPDKRAWGQLSDGWQGQAKPAAEQKTAQQRQAGTRSVGLRSGPRRGLQIDQRWLIWNAPDNSERGPGRAGRAPLAWWAPPCAGEGPQREAQQGQKWAGTARHCQGLTVAWI